MNWLTLSLTDFIRSHIKVTFYKEKNENKQMAIIRTLFNQQSSNSVLSYNTMIEIRLSKWFWSWHEVNRHRRWSVCILWMLLVLMLCDFLKFSFFVASCYILESSTFALLVLLSYQTFMYILLLHIYSAMIYIYSLQKLNYVIHIYALYEY